MATAAPVARAAAGAAVARARPARARKVSAAPAAAETTPRSTEDGAEEETATASSTGFDRSGYSASSTGKATSAAWSPPKGGDLSGVILALVAWGWVVQPYLTGGTSGVKDTLRAKFFNKGPDGGWLA